MADDKTIRKLIPQSVSSGKDCKKDEKLWTRYNWYVLLILIIGHQIFWFWNVHSWIFVRHLLRRKVQNLCFPQPLFLFWD